MKACRTRTFHFASNREPYHSASFEQVGWVVIGPTTQRQTVVQAGDDFRVQADADAGAIRVVIPVAPEIELNLHDSFW